MAVAISDWPQWVQDVRAQAVAQKHFDAGLIEQLRAGQPAIVLPVPGLTDDQLVAFLTDHYGTPEGQQEAARSGLGGRDPAEIARLVVGGR